jgi:mannosyltransferase
VARTILLSTAIAWAVALSTAWVVAQFVPGWANRYLAITVGAALLVCAGALVSGPRWLIAGLVLAVGPSFHEVRPKSNVAAIAAAVPRLGPGDLVVSTQPEQVPALSYYLPPGVRYATPLGPVADPGVMDWRDALPELEAARPAPDLAPLVARLAPGRLLVLVVPVFDGRWASPWLRAVRERTGDWEAALAADRRLRRVSTVPAGGRTERTRVSASIFRRTVVR